MSKSIQKINAENFLAHLIDKKPDLTKPLVLAIDCDRTIVDRNKGSHSTTKEVIELFQKVQNDERFLVVVNTGRDKSNYHPVQIQISHKEPCLFLSGRVLQHDNQSVTLPGACIPRSFCERLWEKFITGEIPFLDVKHATGNALFALPSRSVQHYFGLYKPKDWYEHITLKESEDENYFHSLNSVRFELPFMKKEHPEIYTSIVTNDNDNLRVLLIKFFGLDSHSPMYFIPVKVHKTYAKYHEEIAYVRVMINTKEINKGTGMKMLLQKFGIPYENLICFGDSAGDSASDSAIKQVIPESTLLITEDGDPHAISKADFIIDGVGNNGVPKAFNYILESLTICGQKNL